MKKQIRLVKRSSALVVAIGACCVLLGAVQAVGADASAKGEGNDDEYGTIPSLSLNPAKARVLLTLCLMKGMGLAAITEAFETH